MKIHNKSVVHCHQTKGSNEIFSTILTISFVKYRISIVTPKKSESNETVH